MTVAEPTEQDIVQRLAELLGVRSAEIRIEHRRLRRNDGVDFEAIVGFQRFAIETHGTGDVAAISRRLPVLAAARATAPGQLLLFVAPFIQPGARKRLEEAGVSWFDLSGNATITGPGLRIVLLGKPNRFVRRGRPSTPFAPKSSRVIRSLFVNGPMRQVDLVRQTGLDAGYVSRTVGRLVEEGLVRRGADGVVAVQDRALALDAWHDVYDFGKHEVTRYSLAARSGGEALHRLGQAFADVQISHAATGLAAAWLWTRFASFRTTTFFVAELPTPERLERLGLYPSEGEGTVWLAVPNDASVFTGTSQRDGARVVHPLQAWLDLKSQPERSAEAAEELRSLVLGEAHP